MIKIQDWQMDRLERRRTEVVDRILSSIVVEDMQVSPGDARISGWIAAARAAGERYGFDRDADVERYLIMMLSLGDDFDTTVDWARDILTREDFTGHVRIDVLWATWNDDFGDGPEDIL
jgi:hypothetical protein